MTIAAGDERGTVSMTGPPRLAGERAVEAHPPGLAVGDRAAALELHIAADRDRDVAGTDDTCLSVHFGLVEPRDCDPRVRLLHPLEDRAEASFLSDDGTFDHHVAVLLSLTARRPSSLIARRA